EALEITKSNSETACSFALPSMPLTSEPNSFSARAKKQLARSESMQRASVKLVNVLNVELIVFIVF
ncbi:MAG: hypothetical protein ACRCT2_12840, partial [Plesiomonas shigelloides]